MLKGKPIDDIDLDDERVAEPDKTQGLESRPPNYLATKQAIDALNRLQKVDIGDATRTDSTPIGFELLDHRVNKLPVHQRNSQEYNAQVQTMADRFKEMLSFASGNSRGDNGRSVPKKEKATVVTPSPPKKRGYSIFESNSNSDTKRKKTSRSNRRKCCATWCNNIGIEDWTCVPSCPEKPYSRGGKKPSWNAIKTWRKKQFRRNEFTDRLGLGRRCKKDADLRFCKKHPMELFNGTTISIKLEGGTTKRFPVEAFEAPVPSGGKGFRSPTKKLERALG